MAQWIILMIQSSEGISVLYFRMLLLSFISLSNDDLVFLDILRSLQNVQFCSSSRKAKILNTGICWIFRGLKFEPDAEIGQKGTLCKGLIFTLPHHVADKVFNLESGSPIKICHNFFRPAFREERELCRHVLNHIRFLLLRFGYI